MVPAFSLRDREVNHATQVLNARNSMNLTHILEITMTVFQKTSTTPCSKETCEAHICRLASHLWIVVYVVACLPGIAKLIHSSPQLHSQPPMRPMSLHQGFWQSVSTTQASFRLLHLACMSVIVLPTARSDVSLF
eukprot:c18590_g1_i1 orf=643-1047(-)